MKLIRFGEAGHESPGVLGPDDRPIDVRAFGEDWNEEFFAGNGLPRLQAWLAENSAGCPVLEDDV
ncbi:ureidoglycolate lyase, partial [Gemmatimonadota bacterium]